MYAIRSYYEGNAGGELALAAAVEIELDGDLRFQGIASDFGLPHGLGWESLERRGMIPFRLIFTLSVNSR